MEKKGIGGEESERFLIEEGMGGGEKKGDIMENEGKRGFIR